MERPAFQKAIDFVRSHAREAAAAGILLPAAVLAACKGGQGQEVKTTPTQPANSPVPTETIAPTETAEPTTSPEPTQFVPKKLSDAEFVPTDFQTVLESLTGEKGALVLHPDYTQIYFKDSEVPLSEDNFVNNLKFLGNGNPTEGLAGGSILVELSFYVYAEKGYEEFYDVAVKSSNYFLTQYPENQAKFDEFLSQGIQQSSPSLEK